MTTIFQSFKTKVLQSSFSRDWEYNNCKMSTKQHIKMASQQENYHGKSVTLLSSVNLLSTLWLSQSGGSRRGAGPMSARTLPQVHGGEGGGGSTVSGDRSCSSAELGLECFLYFKDVKQPYCPKIYGFRIS